MKRNPIIAFFDRTEDEIRASLSHHPVFYALIGGIGIVLFWKGVWETAELFPILHGPTSLILGATITLASGLFVSFFIGDSIILSGYKRQKKMAEKTEEEVAKDIDLNQAMKAQLDRVEKELGEIKAKLNQ